MKQRPLLEMPRWVLPTVCAIVALWFLVAIKGVLLPFLAGLALAYLLDPVADRLEAFGMQRWAGVLLILASFFTLAIVFFLLVVPLVSHEVGALFKELPGYVERLRPQLERLLSVAGEERVEGLAEDYAGKIFGIISDAATKFVSGGLKLFNVLSLLLLTPLVSFYLLRDWDKMIAHIDSWLPPRHRTTIERLAGEVDSVLSGWVRGQLTVATIMGVLYAIGWSVIGLDYAVVLGVIAALLCLIPYVGPFMASLLAMLVGFGQFGDDNVRLIAIFGVHIAVQLFEGNILTPRIVGQKVGLDDIWVIFAILAGAELMGFVGILLAVPIAATIAVMLRFGLEQYLASDYYHGMGAQPGTSPGDDETGAE